MAIDDENIVGKMIKTVFEQDGYAVETFLDAKSALARLKEEKFDVVITDLKMKDIDGMELLKIIKKDLPEVKENDYRFCKYGCFHRSISGTCR